MIRRATMHYSRLGWQTIMHNGVLQPIAKPLRDSAPAELTRYAIFILIISRCM